MFRMTETSGVNSLKPEGNPFNLSKKPVMSTYCCVLSPPESSLGIVVRDILKRSATDAQLDANLLVTRGRGIEESP